MTLPAVGDHSATVVYEKRGVSLTAGSGANISLHTHPPVPDLNWLEFSI